MKIDCGIVQDLIPSYADKVCSESSKQCVEEHIKECKACRAYLEACLSVEFSGTALEEKQLDGLRKVKKKIKLQNMFSYGVLLVVILFAAYFFTTNIGAINVRWYYGLYAVAVAATFMVTMQGKASVKQERIEKIMTVMSVAAIVYALFWYWFMMGSAVNGKVPLGLELGQVGPFLHWQTGIALAAEIERNLISQRTKEALAVRKTKGMKLGRPQGSSKKKIEFCKRSDEVLRMLKNGHSMAYVAGIIGIHRNTLRKYLSELGMDE